MSDFKADDKGELDTEMTSKLADTFGHTYAEFFKARRIAVGTDIRCKSSDIKNCFASQFK